MMIPTSPHAPPSESAVAQAGSNDPSASQGKVTIDETTQIPLYQNEEYQQILVRIRQVFEEYKEFIKCTNPTNSESREKELNETRKTLDLRVVEILTQLEGLPDPDHLALLITKAAVARLGIGLHVRHNISRAWDYLKKAQPIEVKIPKAPPLPTDTLPWWTDLEHHWSCFFHTPQPLLKSDQNDPASSKGKVRFAQTPPVEIPSIIDETTQIPPYQNEEYQQILIQLRQLFKEYNAYLKCALAPDSKNLRDQLNQRVVEILIQLDGLPDPDHLALLITKAATARLGMMLHIGYNIYRAYSYIKKAQPIEATIRQVPPLPDVIPPWWTDLENHWRCFFTHLSLDKIDTATQIPPYQNEEYQQILVQIQRLFEQCNKFKERGNRTGSENRRRQLDQRAEEILIQLDGLPNQDHLALLITKAVVARLGTTLHIGYNTSRICAYLKKAQPIEAAIRQAPSLPTDIPPWWTDLTNHWRCFFCQ